MKSISRVMLVVAMVGGLLAVAVGAGAQESNPTAYLANVNGSSNTAVDVAVGTEPVANLEYTAAQAVPYIPAGPTDVTYTAGGTLVASVPIDAAAGTAQTVVSGYGGGGTGGSSYPIDVAPITAGDGKLTIWNATNAAVQADVGELGNGPIPLNPGEGAATLSVLAGTVVSVTIAGVTQDVTIGADSYTDVFAVNDGAAPGIATSVVPSMTDLIEVLAPTPPEPDTVPVPDVVGQSLADAQAAVEAVGLVPADEELPSDDVEAGLVAATNPAAGTEVGLGSTVTMAVSTGPSTVPVPDVVGQESADAQAALEGEGFVVTTTEQASDDVEEGLVISTNPTAGTEVAPGSTVDMAVSTGPEDVVVPEFIGMTVEDATALAEEVGLTITFVQDESRPDPNGVVISQEPAAGESVEAGSEVVAQQAPLVDAPFTVISVDTNRLMTTTGLNFLPGSSVQLVVVGTELGAVVPVDETGVWWESFQLGDAQSEVETLSVEGTSANGSPYRATFQIPPAGGATDEPEAGSEVPAEESSSGFPWWGWLLIALAVVGIGALVWYLVAGRDAAAVTESGGGTPPPPPPPPPAAS